MQKLRAIQQKLEEIISQSKEWGRVEYQLADSDVGSFAADLKGEIVMKNKDELIEMIKES